MQDNNLDALSEFACTTLKKYKGQSILIPTRTNSGEEVDIDICQITTLIINPFESLQDSDYAFLLTLNQRQLLASLINNELLSKSIQ